MLTIRRTARSCPTILPNRRRSKSRTSALLISGSRSTSSEIYGLTIALYLVPVSPGRCQDSHRNQLPLVSVQIVCQSSFCLHIFLRQFLPFGGIAVLIRSYRQLDLGALAAGPDFLDG